MRSAIWSRRLLLKQQPTSDSASASTDGHTSASIRLTCAKGWKSVFNDAFDMPTPESLISIFTHSGCSADAAEASAEITDPGTPAIDTGEDTAPLAALPASKLDCREPSRHGQLLQWLAASIEVAAGVVDTLKACSMSAAASAEPLGSSGLFSATARIRESDARRIEFAIAAADRSAFSSPPLPPSTGDTGGGRAKTRTTTSPPRGVHFRPLSVALQMQMEC